MQKYTVIHRPLLALTRVVMVTFMGLVVPGIVSAIEQPEFEVLYRNDELEYRRYAGYVVAETEVVAVADYNEAANEGFRRLFDYISGANSGQRKIAMTAPVQQVSTAVEGDKIAMTAPVQQVSTATGWRVAFMLPSLYTLEDAPPPTDSRVYLRQVPARVMAVWRYSGRWTQNNFEKHKALLLEQLQLEGVSPVAPPESAVYNPPFMPPFMRRNEIMVEVDSLPAAAHLE